MEWTRSIIVERPLAQVQEAFADEHRLMEWSAWPEATGYRALCSTQLSPDGGPRAALNLYSANPNAFDEPTRTMAGLFGAQASLLLYGADHASNLQRAVDSRDVIGQAKGILMERFGIDDQAAFGMLAKSSQDANLKLTDVAQWMIHPDTPPQRTCHRSRRAPLS